MGDKRIKVTVYQSITAPELFAIKIRGIVYPYSKWMIDKLSLDEAEKAMVREMFIDFIDVDQERYIYTGKSFYI